MKQLAVIMYQAFRRFGAYLVKCTVTIILFCMVWISLGCIYTFMYNLCMVDYNITLDQAMLEKYVLYNQAVIGWLPVKLVKESKPFKELVSLV